MRNPRFWKAEAHTHVGRLSAELRDLIAASPKMKPLFLSPPILRGSQNQTLGVVSCVIMAGVARGNEPRRTDG